MYFPFLIVPNILNGEMSGLPVHPVQMQNGIDVISMEAYAAY